MSSDKKTLALMGASAVVGGLVGAYYMLDRVTKMMGMLASEDPILHSALKRHGL